MPRTIRIYSLSLICAILLASLSSSLSYGENLYKESLEQQIDSYLETLENEKDFNAAVLIARNDVLILRKGYGVADRSRSDLFTPETVVGIASISKQFTAAAIMRLVDKGYLSVDDQLEGILKEVPPDKSGITLHQLLTHTSGLVSDHMTSDLEPLTKQEALSRILSSELLSEPGSEYHYSNSGYTLLAAIVEEVSGLNHDDFLEREFLKPLGMEQTGNWADPRFENSLVSTGYFNGESSGPITDLPGPYWTVIGNGGILSTVDDMFTWYQALQGGEVLSEESTKALFTNYTANGRPIEYGYGWEISQRDGLGRIITHNGGGITGNSILSDYLDQDLLIIILGNTITYRTLGEIPLVIKLPADETSAAVARCVVSGDFSQFPKTTFVIWPYLSFAIVLLVLLSIILVRIIKRRRG